ncbi:hypothetical protein EV368DRAFT_89235 [Lentinula lateritia]|nr:hypothetical protein EV368DRAFT_89235 [Lentinula lateritia]
MAPFDFLPNSEISPTFTKCQDPGGVYNCLGDAFAAMGCAAIANADVNSTFFRYSPNKLQSDCYYYCDNESAEYSGNVFGEILEQAHGTFLGARGNHYPGPNNYKPYQITDQTKARCSKVLGCPSFASEQLQTIGHNQLCTFIGVHTSEADNGNICNVKEIVKSVVPGGAINAITLTSGLLYTTSKRLSKSIHDELFAVNMRSYRKRPLTGRSRSPVVVSDKSDVQLAWPNESEIYVGAEYDHCLMPDYGGELFTLKKAKLVQPDWRDINGALIMPWHNYSSLRPGTLVVANSQVYQALINHLQVVGESDINISVPVLLRSKGNSGSTSEGPSHDPGTDAFANLKAVFVSWPEDKNGTTVSTQQMVIDKE